MARTPLEYLRLLQSLLPRGRAWNRDEDSILTQFLYGKAEEFSRVDGRSDDLLQERDTRYTSELLPDHETDFGIPDECFSLPTTDRQRRNAIHSKLLTTGRQDKQYFIDLAEALGYTIEITEYEPFWCGLGLAGDECGGYKVLFYWKVSVGYPDIVAGGFAKGFGTGFDSLYSADIEALYCIMRKYKPAHSIVIFDFFGPGFDEGFNLGFDSLPSESQDYLEGGFAQGFSLGFDVRLGGGHDKGFDIGFEQSI